MFSGKWFWAKLITAVLAAMLIATMCRGPDKSLTFDGAPDDVAEGRELVILLHGLARTSYSMRKMERELQDAGYLTLNRWYPSRRHTVEELVEEFMEPLVDEVEEKRGPERIHFVTHSLGSIMVRSYAEKNGPDRIGRVVMLAPPNQGSEMADRLKGFAPFRWIFGKPAAELGTGEDDVPAGLPPPRFEVGVIAGTHSWWNPLAWGWIPGESDGTVKVERTRVEGMADFRKVSAGHSLLMRKREVIELTKRFLETGEFD